MTLADLDTLTHWREAAAAAYEAKADALRDALVSLDAVLPLVPENRSHEVRSVEATFRELIRDAEQAREEGRP